MLEALYRAEESAYPPAMKTPRGAAAVLVALIALGGCGGGEPAAEPTDATRAPTTAATSATAATQPGTSEQPGDSDVPDPCALLPVEEVARVTGLDLPEGVLDTSIPTIATCTYTVADGTAVVQSVVQAGPGTREAYDALGRDSEPVEGIGDEARYNEGLRTVDALVGERSLSVSVTAGDDPDAPELRQQAEELAALLAEAL